MRSSSVLSIAFATISAIGLVLLLSGKEQRIQGAAATILLGTIALVTCRDVLVERFHAANIRHYVLLSYALFMGIGMLVDLSDRHYAFNGTALGLCLTGLYAFLIGFALGPRQARRPLPSFQVAPRQLFAVAVALYALGFGFIYLEWYLFGQIMNYAGTFVSSTRKPLPILPMVHEFTNLVLPACLISLVLMRRGVSRGKDALLKALLACTLIWFVLWGARGNFLCLAVGWVIIGSEIKGPDGARRISIKPLLFCAFAVAIMVALSVVRTTWDVSRLQESGAAGAVAASARTLDSYTQLRRTVEWFPARMEFLKGYSFYAIAVNVVPRVWWPQKPMGLGRLASVWFDRTPNNSIGLSLVGELYANFGTPASIVGMLFFGLICRAAYTWYLGRRGNEAALVVYVQLLWCMMQEVRGDMLSTTIRLAYYTVPTIVVFTVLTGLNRTLGKTIWGRPKGRGALRSCSGQRLWRYGRTGAPAAIWRR